ncbi:hypothetical protein L150_01769 [Candida albicans Ca529L]|nr:hypothetical protein L150_01769 [Candida albicans Ca529L]
MDIPLKSKPKVSTVNLLADSKFEIGSTTNSSAPLDIDNNDKDEPSQLNPNYLKIRHSSKNQQQEQQQLEGFPPNYTFSRRYSETEKNNFDPETGHRIFADGKIRPHQVKHEHMGSRNTFTNINDFNNSSEIGRTNGNNHITNNINDSNNNNNNNNFNNNQLHARSHDSNVGYKDETGYEEFIPGLDFSSLVSKWNSNSNSNLDLTRNTTNVSLYTTHSNTPRSRDGSYLDLNLLHSKVAPQPIKTSTDQQRNLSYSKLHEFMKTKQQKNAYNSNNNNDEDNDIVSLTKDNFSRSSSGLGSSPGSVKRETSASSMAETSKARKKQKSAIDPITGEVNYELILNSLPPNFNDMPYSQRKKLVKSFSESIDYSQFSLFAKNYLGSSVGSAKTLKGSSSGTGIASASSSLSRRNRVGSLNTLAGRLLARTSTTDFKKLQEAMKPKYNVDEKGAIVLGHELGKVIGFGAWGTIRECTDQQDGTIRAIKIVKSTRDFDGGSGNGNHSSGNLNSKTDLTGSMKSKNPRVLEVFKKEIQIWKQLHHDNILPLIDYYETEDAIFCIMNRINGGTLFEVVDSWGQFNARVNLICGPLEYSFEEQRHRLLKVIECARQIVQALLYMHEEKGIVHGDLKLENVLVEREKGNCKMILCDFGMSRVYSSRISRKSSKRHIHYKGNNKLSIDGDLEDTLMMRSRSSNIEFRKPYFGGDSPSSRKLDFDIRDDSRVGLANFFRAHGPSMQSIHLTPVVSENGHSPSDGYFDITNKNDNGGNNDKPMFSRYQQVCNDGKEEHGIDSGLPHSHIGSLPYASPEILQPSPPPLGPSADVWAFGVLMYAMIVGRLPFQHHYEPRLRAIIASGKFNKLDLRKACLLEWVLKENAKQKQQNQQQNSDSTDNNGSSWTNELLNSNSLIDMNRQNDLIKLENEWCKYKDKREFEWLYDIVIGCLEPDITKRWDMEMINDQICTFSSI